MTAEDKEYCKDLIVIVLCFTFAALEAVAYEMLKGTALQGLFMVVFGLLGTAFLAIAAVECLGKRVWRRSFVYAAISGVFAFTLWVVWSDTPWRQLPEEIEMVFNIYING